MGKSAIFQNIFQRLPDGVNNIIFQPDQNKPQYRIGIIIAKIVDIAVYSVMIVPLG